MERRGLLNERMCVLLPIGAGASHRLADLHAAELPKKISRSCLDDPVSGSITRKSIIRRDQPGLTLVERNVSLNRFVEFGEITETPFGLRGNSARFPVLDRALGHTNGDCELRLCQPKTGTQRFDVDSNFASRTAWDRARSRGQIEGTSHVTPDGVSPRSLVLLGQIPGRPCIKCGKHAIFRRHAYVPHRRVPPPI